MCPDSPAVLSGKAEGVARAEGNAMESIGKGYAALVVGESGGIGGAVHAALSTDPNARRVVGLSRRTHPGFDITNEPSVADAAATLAGESPFDLIFDATGALTIDGVGPEKALKAIDPSVMARQFAVNAIGPALLLKHFAPLMPRDRRAIFATLSARVGSIGDNRLGGWISYRASKAALNQIVRTAAIELSRTHPQSLVLVLHPGTVETRLSAAFRGGHPSVTPSVSAARLLALVDRLPAQASGGFYAHDGEAVVW